MKWDDELERLSNAAVDAFGENALNAAIERAYAHAAIRRQTESSTSRDADFGSASGLASFEECLREELRRMLRPH